jgi:hypothetical protein
VKFYGFDVQMPLVPREHFDVLIFMAKTTPSKALL